MLIDCLKCNQVMCITHKDAEQHRCPASVSHPSTRHLMPTQPPRSALATSNTTHKRQASEDLSSARKHAVAPADVAPDMTRTPAAKQQTQAAQVQAERPNSAEQLTSYQSALPRQSVAVQLAPPSPPANQAPISVTLLPVEMVAPLSRFLESFEAAITTPGVNPRKFVPGLNRCLRSAHRQLVPKALLAIQSAYHYWKLNHQHLTKAFTVALEAVGVLDLFETWQRLLPTDHVVYVLTQLIIGNYMHEVSIEYPTSASAAHPGPDHYGSLFAAASTSAFRQLAARTLALQLDLPTNAPTGTVHNPNDVAFIVWQYFRDSAFVADNSTTHVTLGMVDSFAGSATRVGQVNVPPHTIDGPSAFDSITYNVKIRTNQPPVLLAWTLAHEFLHIEISGVLRLARKSPVRLYDDPSRVEGLCELAGLLVCLSCWSQLRVSAGDADAVFTMLRNSRDATQQHLRSSEIGMCAHDATYRVGLWRALQAYEAYVKYIDSQFGDFIRDYLSQGLDLLQAPHEPH